MNYDAILLFAFGGPAKFEEVKPFLANVTLGHNIPKERILTVIEQYKLIGGASPLTNITYRQAKLLEDSLKSKGIFLRVYVGMRNWTPLIQDTLVEMKNHGVKKALGIVMSLYRSEASWDRYLQALSQARENIGSGAPEIEFLNLRHDHPAMIDTIGERIMELQSFSPNALKEDCYWIFSAHSIPLWMDQKSGYSQQILDTAKLVANRFQKKNWAIAFQSRSGSSEESWLEPDINDKLKELSSSGARSVLVIPVGFVSDHVEVLYDLDIKAKNRAEELKIAFYRSKTVNDHPKFIELLAELCMEKL